MCPDKEITCDDGEHLGPDCCPAWNRGPASRVAVNKGAIEIRADVRQQKLTNAVCSIYNNLQPGVVRGTEYILGRKYRTEYCLSKSRLKGKWVGGRSRRWRPRRRTRAGGSNSMLPAFRSSIEPVRGCSEPESTAQAALQVGGGSIRDAGREPWLPAASSLGSRSSADPTLATRPNLPRPPFRCAVVRSPPTSPCSPGSPSSPSLPVPSHWIPPCPAKRDRLRESARGRRAGRLALLARRSATVRLGRETHDSPSSLLGGTTVPRDLLPLSTQRPPAAANAITICPGRPSSGTSRRPSSDVRAACLRAFVHC